MTSTLRIFIDKLSNHLQQHNILEKIINNLKIEYGLIACIGVEIEFYLSENIDITQFESFLEITLKKEKGKNQFEIDLPPSTNIINYIEEITTTKQKIEIIAKKLQGTVNFRAKPFPNDYGNSMHFHLNFLNANSKKGALQMIDYAEILLEQAARGICHYMLDSFLVFMPYMEDYLRLDKNFMAPTTVSFGNNNRSVALRIPDSYPKRLEHRISTPSTDIYLAIFTILNSVFLGLKFPEQIKPMNKIYGNAFDKQYNLLQLPKSAKEALQLFKLEFFMPSHQQELTLFVGGQNNLLSLKSLLSLIKELECYLYV